MGPIEAAAIQRHRELRRKHFPVHQPQPVKPSTVPAWVVNKPEVFPKLVPRHTMRGILAHVARRFDVPELDIISPRRDRKVIVPRFIICYLARKLTTQSMPAIGRLLGDRDHTSILNAIEKTTSRRDEDVQFAALLEDIERDLTGEFR
jgi:chromosomal replication initiator protein